MWHFDQISRSYKVAHFTLIQRKEVIPANYETFYLWFYFFFFFFFTILWKKKTPIKFYGAFDHFSRTYEVAKFQTIKLYLDVSDVVHAIEHAKYAICDLHVNFQVFVNVILFYNEKGSF